jgi:hypothetical protein
MTALDTFADLETPLYETPLFYVEPPDGRKDWPEFDRQRALFRHMRSAAPAVCCHSVPNEGKRHTYFAKAAGLTGGVFDTAWHHEPPLSAFIEMKGYDARGRPGSLSDAQITWGNRMHRLGHHVACFFSPHNAAEWLRGLGFPFVDLTNV